MVSLHMPTFLGLHAADNRKSAFLSCSIHRMKLNYDGIMVEVLSAPSACLLAFNPDV
jgi:hypothetical protein